MGAATHHDGKKMAGTHTTVIEGVVPVIEVIRKSFPDARICNGYIEAGIHAKSQSIKIKQNPTALEIVVVMKVTKQTLVIYGKIDLQKLVEDLKACKKLRGFKIKTE